MNLPLYHLTDFIIFSSVRIVYFHKLTSWFKKGQRKKHFFNSEEMLSFFYVHFPMALMTVVCDVNASIGSSSSLPALPEPAVSDHPAPPGGTFLPDTRFPA